MIKRFIVSPTLSAGNRTFRVIDSQRQRTVCACDHGEDAVMLALLLNTLTELIGG